MRRIAYCSILDLVSLTSSDESGLPMSLGLATSWQQFQSSPPANTKDGYLAHLDSNRFPFVLFAMTPPAPLGSRGLIKVSHSQDPRRPNLGGRRYPGICAAPSQPILAWPSLEYGASILPSF